MRRGGCIGGDGVLKYTYLRGKGRGVMQKYGKWVATVATLLWCVFIWQFSLSSGSSSAQTSGEVLGACNGFLESIGVELQFSSTTVRKCAHFAEFFVLGVLAALTLFLFGVRLWLPCSALIFLPVAVIDECIQLFVPDRGPGMLDVLLDSLGGAVGALVFYLVLSLIYILKNKRKEKRKNFAKTS